MGKLTQQRRAVALGVIGAVTLVGCGSSKKSTADTTVAAAAETTAAATETTAAATETTAAATETTAAATETTAASATETTAAAAAAGTPNLTDAYSKQIERSRTIDVDTTPFKKTAPFKIATVVQGPINGWGTIFDTVMNAAIAESGKIDAKSVIYAPWNGKTENQTKGIDDAIAAKVDGILLTSLSRAGLAASVDRAKAAGIPVVVCMAGVETDSYTTEVSRDIPLMGYQSAKAVAEKLGGKGNVVMLSGIPGVDAAEFWKSGAKAAFAEYPDIKIVAEQNGNWSVADSLTVMQSVVAQQSQIDAVWVGGLEMGVSVVNAFKQAGRKVPFIGGTNPINGFLKVAKAEGLDFFVVPFPPGASKQCVQTLISVLEGQPVKKFNDVIDTLDGSQPYGPDQLDKWYVPTLNDDFIGPLVYPETVFTAAGFAKK